MVPPVIDLHAHTTASDGSLTPTELVAHAAEIGLRAVAVTDHDTVDGLPEALAAAVERLAGDPQLQMRLAASAGSLVEQFSPQQAAATYVRALHRTIASAEAKWRQ